MENPADTPPTSNVIPAGHAALTTEDDVGEYRPDGSTGLAGLSVAASMGFAPKVRFSRDSLQERHGFKLSVPRGPLDRSEPVQPRVETNTARPRDSRSFISDSVRRGIPAPECAPLKFCIAA
jgi:hypothetical protein